MIQERHDEQNSVSHLEQAFNLVLYFGVNGAMPALSAYPGGKRWSHCSRKECQLDNARDGLGAKER